MRRWIIALLLVWFVLFLTACSDESAKADSSSPNKLTVALVPSEDALKMVEGFEPIRLHLEKQTGKKVEVIKSTSYAAVIEGLKGEKVDIAWLGPLSYNLAKRQAEIEPLAIGDDIEKGPTYRSLLLVRADSPYKSLNDLKGKKLAMVDPGSTSGFLVPTTLIIKETGQKPEEFFSDVAFAGSHDASLLQLKAGSVEAAAVQDITFDDYAKAGKIDKAQFRIIVTSDPLPGSPLVLRAGLDPKLKTAVREAILNAHEQGVKLEVAGMGTFKRFIEAKDEDFAFIADMVDALGLTDDQLAN